MFRIVLMPPLLGLLKDVTGSFTPPWALLCTLTVVALTVTARRELRASARSAATSEERDIVRPQDSRKETSQ